MSYPYKGETLEYRWWTLTNPHNFHIYLKDDIETVGLFDNIYNATFARYERLYIREQWMGFKGEMQYGPPHRLNTAPDGVDGKFLTRYAYAPRRVDIHMAGIPPIGIWVPTENY